MQHLTLNPNATLGLFIAHRAYDAKGGPHIRAQGDADRVFLKEQGGLLKALDGGRVEVVEKGEHEVALENHIYEHFERALSAAAESGQVFGFGTPEKPRQPIPWFEAAEDALKGAVKKDVPARPALVLEKDEKKKSKSA